MGGWAEPLQPAGFVCAGTGREPRHPPALWGLGLLRKQLLASATHPAMLYSSPIDKKQLPCLGRGGCQARGMCAEQERVRCPYCCIRLPHSPSNTNFPLDISFLCGWVQTTEHQSRKNKLPCEACAASTAHYPFSPCPPPPQVLENQVLSCTGVQQRDKSSPRPCSSFPSDLKPKTEQMAAP